MKTLSSAEVDIVSGAVSSDAAYGAAVGVGVALLGVALAVTAPAWGTAMLLGASIAASGFAIDRIFQDD